MVTSVRGLKVKKDAAKGGGKKGAAMVKPVLEVEEDAHKEIHSNFPKNSKHLSVFLLFFPGVLTFLIKPGSCSGAQCFVFHKLLLNYWANYADIFKDDFP